MKNAVLSLSLIFFLFGCSSPDEDKPEKEKPTMVLKCKYNPSALYVDTFTFFADNSVIRTKDTCGNQVTRSFQIEGTTHLILLEE